MKEQVVEGIYVSGEHRVLFSQSRTFFNCLPFNVILKPIYKAIHVNSFGASMPCFGDFCSSRVLDRDYGSVSGFGQGDEQKSGYQSSLN